VAAEWLGHTALVAQKHYWRVTDEDFARTIAGEKSGAIKGHQRALMGAGAAQKKCGNPGKTTVSAPHQLPGQDSNTADKTREDSTFPEPGPQPGPFFGWLQELAALLDACPLSESTRRKMLALAEQDLALERCSQAWCDLAAVPAVTSGDRTRT
jgi:hypothetical protein